jgi:hypothetical protein
MRSTVAPLIVPGTDQRVLSNRLSFAWMAVACSEILSLTSELHDNPRDQRRYVDLGTARRREDYGRAAA